MSRPSYELAHCIVCGHRDARILSGSEDLQREVELLWEYHQSRLRPETPPARLMDRVAFSEHAPLRLVQCRECGLVYRNPVERARELTAIYEDDAPTEDTLRALHDAQCGSMRTQARAVRQALHGGATGLEIGSYVGAFLTAARDEGLHFEGLDVNRRVNCFTRSLGFVAHDGDLVEFAAGADRTFDAVAIWNAFDQLADPRASLHAARKVLAPGGLLALRVPNGAFYARWKGRLGARRPTVRTWAAALLAQNNLLTFPYRWGFTPRSLARLVREARFRVVGTRGDVLVRTADEWTRSWARLEETVIKGFASLPLRLRADWSPWFDLYARML